MICKLIQNIENLEMNWVLEDEPKLERWFLDLDKNDGCYNI